jgi:CheY-like chemotaxis protein
VNEASFVVCEAQPLMLQALLAHLEDLGHTVLVSTTDLDTAIEAVKAQKPDVLLLGTERTGRELIPIKALRTPGRRLSVLVYGPDHPETVLAALR